MTAFIAGGLSADGHVIVEPDDVEDSGTCVDLLALTATTTGGYVLAPANTDLPCVVNESEELTGEIHLIDGTRLEVANKTLVFIDGPIPVRRRKLPRTPGMPLEESPPCKPNRAQTPEMSQAPLESKTNTCNFHTEHPDNPDDTEDSSDTEEEDEDRRWLETSWCMLDMPTAEQHLFSDLDTPEQISIVAASYFCKQVRLFTDANVTTQLLDDIFKLFKDSVIISKDIFLDYLSEISKLIQKNPRRSQTRPMHGPAIKLLNNLLKQSLEPLPRAILLLDLLRTFSHFDTNLPTMARHQVAASVCGCMSVYYDVVEVQSYGLDTLAKIAKFKPVIDKKAPLREGAVQIILKSENQHHKNLNICRSLCRVLANLASSLIDVTNSLLDTETGINRQVTDAIEQYEEILLFMFKRSLPTAQTILDDHGTDLGVHTEGRRFVYYYAKLPQLQQKKKAWLLAAQEETVEEIIHEEDPSAPIIQDMLAYRTEENEPRGILKKIGSFESLRDPNKKIVFADSTVGGSDSDSSSSDDELFSGPFPEPCIPTQIDMTEDFTFQLVKKFIGKTVGKKSIDSSDDSDEEDFLNGNSDKSLAVKVNTEEGEEVNKNACRLKLISENSKISNGQYMNRNEENRTDVMRNTSDNLIAQNDPDFVSSSKNTAEGGDENDRECESSKESCVINENIPSEKRETEVLCSETGLDDSCSLQTRDISENAQESDIQTETLQNKNDNRLSSASDKTFLANGKGNSIHHGWDIIDNGELRETGESVRQEVVETVTIEKDRRKQYLETSSSENKDNLMNIGVQHMQYSDNVDGTNEALGTAIEKNLPAHSYSANTSCAVDVPFMGKLVRTQIVTHVGSLVFQGDDSKVLLVIDQPITELLEHASAPAGLIEFARNQYGKDMTLMDLEPSIVISAIDAVRYRSVTAELVQKAILSLTRAITHSLQSATVNLTMLFYKTVYADENLKSIITDKEFVQEFKVCFSKATERLQTSHSIEEIRATLATPSFVV